MKLRRINGNWYKIPTRLADVRLSQYADFCELNKKRITFLKRKEKASTEQEQNLLNILEADVFDRMIASISSIEYATLEKMEVAQKSKVYQHFEQIMKVINFELNEKKQSKYFKFKGDKFYLFELGTITAKQMLWFETYWKDFYQVVSKEVVETDFSQLAKLIAICAFKKKEVDMLLSDGRELPVELTPEYYAIFSKLVEDRTIMFQNLDMEIVFGCLNFFFANSKTIRQLTQTSSETAKNRLN